MDLSDGTAVPATILVEDGHVTEVGPPDQVKAPPGARIVDARGAYVTPGLWDMHAHTTYANRGEVERAFFGPLVAHGVVGIRDPASRFPIEQVRRWRAAISDGTLVGPRIAAVGGVVDARITTIGTIVVRNEDEARHAVELLKRDGYDFVKPYNDLSTDSYRALTAQARRLGIPVAGHLPYTVDARTASDAGQRSIEHLTNLWFEAASSGDVIRARILSGLARGESPVALFQVKIDSLFPLAFQTYDAEKEHELFAYFVRNSTWQTPTLIVDRRYLRCGAAGDSEEDASVLRLVPRWVRASGRALSQFLARLTPEQCATLAALYRREAAMVGRMQRAGVGLLAGTDAPQAYLAPGPSLHDELDALVSDAGLTPLEALRTATVNAARFFDSVDSAGAVRSGYVADLVLLDANPATDIRNLRRIRAVILRGRLLDRAALDALLAEAERVAGGR